MPTYVASREERSNPAAKALVRLEGMLAATAAAVPPPITEALTGWHNLCDVDIQPGSRLPAATERAIEVLTAAANGDLDAAVKAAGKIVAAAADLDAQADRLRSAIISARNVAAQAAVDTIGDNGHELFDALRERYTVAAVELVTAARQIPENFEARDATWAADKLRRPWVSAQAAAAEMLALHELANVIGEKSTGQVHGRLRSVQYVNSTKVADQTDRFGVCLLGTAGTVEFLVKVARLVADASEMELLSPAARNARAFELWPTGSEMVMEDGHLVGRRVASRVVMNA